MGKKAHYNGTHIELEIIEYTIYFLNILCQEKRNYSLLLVVMKNKRKE